MALHLVLPWIIIGLLALIVPSSRDVNAWMLQGMQAHFALYGFSAPLAKYGILGIFIPLALLHNVSYVLTRLIQSRMDLDFLPMIRSFLGFVGVLLLSYGLWVSFVRGATFGEFHNLVANLLPVLAFLVGLGFFVGRLKGHGPAQLTALLVAWSPLYSVAASLAGNRLRPPNLFQELVVEPGGLVSGFESIDEKTLQRGFVRLLIEKEGIVLNFPALARNIKIETGKDKSIIKFASDLDWVSRTNLLKVPEQIEDAGWRPMADNSVQLENYCHAPITSKPEPIRLEWVKANALLSIEISFCAERARWSLGSTLQNTPLGELSRDRATLLKDRRESDSILLSDVDQNLLSGRDWRQRKLGYGLLGQVNDPSVISLLLKGFYDQDQEVRHTAALALLSWGSRIDEVLGRALSDSNPVMRGDSLRLLSLVSRFKPPAAAFRLLNDSNDYVRVSAVQALEPFSKDNEVLKALVVALEREYARAFVKNTPLEHLKNPIVAELIVAIAHAHDVRTATLLLKVLPRDLSGNALSPGGPEFEAARALRLMSNWMGVDYLQAIVKRSSNIENREKALSLMLLFREAGDDLVFDQALNDPDLGPFAHSLAARFKSGPMTSGEVLQNPPSLGPMLNSDLHPLAR